jgi:hypothetical protein
VSPHPVISSLTITTPGIQKLLNNITQHKDSGPDNISGRILKYPQNLTAPILTIIFFKNHSRLAAYHLTGNMQMLHQHTKKCEKHNAMNYRPNSLICISCKIMEHVITKRILNHLKKQQFII